MKLELKPEGMIIKTENIQDVYYLKQIGFNGDNPDIFMKVLASQICDLDGKESEEIEICWEDKNSEHVDYHSDYDSVVPINYLEGPAIRYKAEVAK